MQIVLYDFSYQKDETNEIYDKGISILQSLLWMKNVFLIFIFIGLVSIFVRVISIIKEHKNRFVSHLSSLSQWGKLFFLLTLMTFSR